jgi:hypothetical protein
MGSLKHSRQEIIELPLRNGRTKRQKGGKVEFLAVFEQLILTNNFFKESEVII